MAFFKRARKALGTSTGRLRLKRKAKSLFTRSKAGKVARSVGGKKRKTAKQIRAAIDNLKKNRRRKAAQAAKPRSAKTGSKRTLKGKITSTLRGKAAIKRNTRRKTRNKKLIKRGVSGGLGVALGKKRNRKRDFVT